jgi:hypothetical protein
MAGSSCRPSHPLIRSDNRRHSRGVPSTFDWRQRRRGSTTACANARGGHGWQKSPTTTPMSDLDWKLPCISERSEAVRHSVGAPPLHRHAPQLPFRQPLARGGCGRPLRCQCTQGKEDREAREHLDV